MQRRHSFLSTVLIALVGCSPDGSSNPDGGAADARNPADGGGEAIVCDGYDEADYPEEPASFDVAADGVTAVMAGFITGSTPAAVEDLLADHPELELIIMPFVPGSADDVANLEAARKIHAAGVATCVPAQGLIASGGVDFFLAGERRAAGDGARLGVHSWATGDGTEGAELPRDHPDHALFLDYYEEIGIDEAFYWFTLDAAPAADVHWMTPAELDTYGVLTE